MTKACFLYYVILTPLFKASNQKLKYENNYKPPYNTYFFDLIFCSPKF